MEPTEFERDLQALRAAAQAWPSIRQKWCTTIVEGLYGGLPPPMPRTQWTLLHRAPASAYGGGTLESWQLAIGINREICFVMQRLVPAGRSRFATVVSGDACWPAPNDAARSHAIEQGIGLVWFNRTEIAEDLPPSLGLPTRAATIYQLHPRANFGAIAAWAWAYHRVVDALVEIDSTNADQIVLTGHSRGGKAALLAGATDPRIWLTHANNAGAAGAASQQVTSAGCETLTDLARTFPHWLARNWASQPEQIATWWVDQALLLACIAPRKVFITQASDDLWANPAGTEHAVRTAQAVYALVAPNAAEQVHLHTRNGGHALCDADWLALFAQIGRAASC
jgi:hypothetical protein